MTATPAGRHARIALLIAWGLLASWLAIVHVVWRDEMRAMTLALTPGSLIDMWRAVHGEGHPALWYILVRATHLLLPVPQALQVAAFAVGAGGALLFAWRARLSWPLIGLALFGRFFLFEYTVMARNYGISLLVLFAFAATYRRCRDRGWVPGGLLFLLCNTNAHSVVLAGALLLFWLIDLATGETRAPAAAWRGFAIGAALAAAGVIACALTVYPPFNDAASAPNLNGSPLVAPFKLGKRFAVLIPEAIREDSRKWLVPILLVGTLLRFAHRPSLFCTALGGMFGLSALFTFVYEGAYRHVALLLPFLLTLAWLEGEGAGGRWPGRRMPPIWLMQAGAAALAALLALQIAQSVSIVRDRLLGQPESRSREFAALLRQPAYRRAIVLADPDYMLEPLPYYVSNSTYFVRERRFGRVTIFSKAANHPVSLGDILDGAARLHARTDRPILIAMSETLYFRGTPGYWGRGFYGAYQQTGSQIARWRAETRPVARFADLPEGDESYEVVLFTGPRR